MPALGKGIRTKEVFSRGIPVADPAFLLEDHDRVPKMMSEVLVIEVGDDQEWCLTCFKEIMEDWDGRVDFRYRPTRNVWRPEMGAFQFRRGSLTNNQSGRLRFRTTPSGP